MTASGSIAGSSAIMPDVELQHRLALGAHRAVARRWRARDAGRPPRRGPDDPRAAARAVKPPRRQAEARRARRSPTTRPHFAREMVIHRDMPAHRASTSRRASPRRAAPRRIEHVDGLLDALQFEARGPAQAGPPPRQGHVGRAAARPHRARRRPFRQGLLIGAAAQEGLLGARHRRAVDRGRHRSICRSPSSRAPAARRCMSTRRKARPRAPAIA